MQFLVLCLAERTNGGLSHATPIYRPPIPFVVAPTRQDGTKEKKGPDEERRETETEIEKCAVCKIYPRVGTSGFRTQLLHELL